MAQQQMMAGQGRMPPIMVMDTKVQREEGRKAQLNNIQAARAVADIIRTCLGPRSMLKMILDPMGGIVLTNDGNAILREIDVSHPAAKSMIELSRAQDENVGDGTTSVIILAGEILTLAEPLIKRKMHPAVIVEGYYKAMEDAVEIAKKIAFEVDTEDREAMLKTIRSCIGTKFISSWSDLMCGLALDAVRTVEEREGDQKTIDFKRYARIEKIPGGEIEECCVIRGVMINKDVIHASMRRRIENPRIVLLDTGLEYKKGESQTNIEVSKAGDWSEILRMEEEEVARMVDAVLAVKPDLVVTEKGCSDIASHLFQKAGVTCLRRLRKTDNNRLARATGATIVSRPEELTEADVGTGCGLFEIRKIGDEYFSFMEQCKSPKACTLVLRGANKDVLNEVERNLLDALQTARNVMIAPQLVAGGGAFEMAIAHGLRQKANAIKGRQKHAYLAVANAMEVIPRTLCRNCGANPVRVLTALRAKHSKEGNVTFGVNGVTGKVVDMREIGMWEPLEVKLQTLKTAVEAGGMLLRIDAVVSGAGGAGKH